MGRRAGVCGCGWGFQQGGMSAVVGEVFTCERATRAALAWRATPPSARSCSSASAPAGPSPTRCSATWAPSWRACPRGCCCPSSRCASAVSEAPQALRSVARSPLLVRVERGAPVGEALSKRHKRPPPLVCHMPLAVFFIIFLRFFFFVVGSADTPSEPLGLD